MMGYGKLHNGKTRAEALAHSASHPLDLYFPTDATTIIKGGKEYGGGGDTPAPAPSVDLFTAYGYHDIAAYGNGNPSFVHNGTGVTPTSSNYSTYLRLFDHRGDTYIDVEAGKALVTTWTTAIQYSYISVIKIDGGYSGSNTVDILVEGYVGGVWSTIAESKDVKFADSSIYIKGSFGTSNTSLRLTITNKSSANVYICDIQLLTLRPTNQGIGKHIDMPISWDALCNILPRVTGANIGSSSNRFNTVYANKIECDDVCLSLDVTALFAQGGTLTGVAPGEFGKYHMYINVGNGECVTVGNLVSAATSTVNLYVDMYLDVLQRRISRCTYDSSTRKWTCQSLSTKNL